MSCRAFGARALSKAANDACFGGRSQLGNSFADGGEDTGCADGRMMQIWEVPTEDTFRLAAAGEGYVLTLLPDR